jgi:hypothetical protein
LGRNAFSLLVPYKMTKNLIVIAVKENLKRLHLETLPTVRKYAEKIQASLLVVDHANEKTKIKTAKYAADCGYDKILYLPGSVVVKTEENVFDVCGNSHFAAATQYKPDGLRAGGAFYDNGFFSSEIFVCKPSVMLNFEGFWKQGFLTFDEALSAFLALSDVMTFHLPKRFVIGPAFFFLQTEIEQEDFIAFVRKQKEKLYSKPD